jgi:hypothetical protein
MAVLICHPGTGTIIDAADCYLVIVDDETTTEDVEEAMDGFENLAAPIGMTLHTLHGAAKYEIAKHIYPL